MRACPDLIKFQFTLLEPYIGPRVSLKWVAAMKFAREVSNLYSVFHLFRCFIKYLYRTNSITDYTISGRGSMFKNVFLRVKCDPIS